MRTSGDIEDFEKKNIRRAERKFVQAHVPNKQNIAFFP